MTQILILPIDKIRCTFVGSLYQKRNNLIFIRHV